MEKEIQVIKRSKEKEVFKIDKINKTVKWAVDGIKDVSLSDIEINAKINIRDGITTEEIHQVLIESAANLITIDTPNYQYVAARLLTYQLRKNVWGGKNPPKLIDLIKKNVGAGVYTSEILDLYSEKELNKIDEFIDHGRDFIFTYAGIKQLIDKYLVQNRKTKEVFETPQFAYILIAAIAFAKYPKETRLDYVKKAYNYFSKHKINLPTPIMAGVRTPLKSFASCLLAGVDDSMASILANVSAIGHATANRYGIGFNFAHVRALGAPIRNGDVIHTGKIPFLKVFESTVKSCHQNGIRGGSATTTVFVFDYEIEDIVVLKNNAGTEENRVRKLDYSIGMSKLFYQRWLSNENITLFSSHECKDLFEKFGTEEFDELYVKYEKDSSLKFKKTISARDLFDLITKERIETGRIYIINVDNVNSHSSWLDTVQMSNLCVTGDTLIDIQTDGQNLTVQMKDLDFYVKTSEDLKVKSFDISSKQVVYSEITAFAQTGESIELIEIEDEKGNIVKCTPEHKIFTENKGYVLAQDLVQDDILITNAPTKISKISRYQKVEPVYDITVKNTENFFANNILVHNCQEVTHPVIPLKSLEDKDAEIGICILAAINWLEIASDIEFEKVCDITVRMLDEVIDYQEYFCPAAENFATKRRSLGIGVTNVAAVLAKNNLKYEDKEAPNFVADFMEKQQYFCLKSSMELAKEKGKCEKFDRTTYSKGLLPIDHYKKDKLDAIVTTPLKMDWETLRKDILQHGLRNSTTTAHMPCESCQALDTRIQTPQGIFTLEDLFAKAGLDTKSIEEQGVPGWYELPEPFYVKTLEGDQIVERAYYNGNSSDVYEIEFEDGKSYKFTGNHKLLVSKGSFDAWICVRDLKEEDNIVCLQTNSSKISKITKLTEQVQTYDIEVANVHHYALENGCIAHNSSVIQNSTNGFEPIRSLITYKKSKASTVPVIAPNAVQWKNRYTIAFDMKDNIGYLNIVAAIQKFTDMAMSVNFYYDYSHYPNKMIPHSKVIKEMMHHYSLGGKTIYYTNTNDNDKEQLMNKEEDSSCAGGACTI